MGENTLFDVRFISDMKDMLSQSVELFGSKNAFLIKNNEGKYSGVTYSQFKDDIDSLGTALMDLGLKGEHIAVIGENRYEWCATYLAVVNGVGVIVPLDKELPIHEIENLLISSKSTAVVFSSKLSENIKKLAPALTSVKYFICMDDDCSQQGFHRLNDLINYGRVLISNGDRSYIDTKIDNEKMSILLYTSGTTGLAKGVMLSHKNICSNIMAVCSTVKFYSSDSVLSILPIHHTYECTCGFLAMIYNGGTIAFCEGLRYIADNIKETNPTMLIVVPLLLENLYKKIVDKIKKKWSTRFLVGILAPTTAVLYKLFKVDIRKKIFKEVHQNLGGKLRLIITGAAAIDPKVSDGLNRMGFTVLQGYGLTECSPLVSGNRVCANNTASVGLPMPGVEIRIDNPDKNGIGEVVVRGNNIMLGYYENIEATNRCLKDGWFYTGDIGSLDKNGFLHIAGRIKNVIVTKNGKNIYPEEVECYVNRSPFVLESLVWGDYDEKSGETLVYAQIVPNFETIKERLKGAIPSKDEVYKIISEAVKSANKNMPLYKHIKNFSIRDSEFIKTTTKKIKRYMEKKECKQDIKG